MTDPNHDLAGLIETMPKAELHLHIEGSLEPEMLVALAARNGVELPYRSAEAVREAYAFSQLQDFLDIYYQGMSVLLTAQDFYDLTWAYLERVHGQNVIHVEIFFDPQGHTERGIAFETVLDGIDRALQDGQRKLGITSRLIMCFLRHLSEEAALETLEQALPHKARIAGVGLDSSEVGHPPAKFEQVFAKARAAGFLCVAHAGEEGPPDYVRDTLDLLKVDRIDHGNRAMEDPALIARLAASEMTLTVCPLSNLRLSVVEDLARHPLPAMLNQGLRATVNSDDPAYFGGYINENYLALHRAVSLSYDQIVSLGRNAFLGSFLSEDDKSAALQRFDACLADFARADGKATS